LAIGRERRWVRGLRVAGGRGREEDDHEEQQKSQEAGESHTTPPVGNYNSDLTDFSLGRAVERIDRIGAKPAQHKVPFDYAQGGLSTAFGWRLTSVGMTMNSRDDNE
jgi:hypothetical protein